jgi:transposase
MSARFVSVDRETPMLLPPDMKDWVAEDDLAHFILEVVQGVDTSMAKVNERGSGSEQYPPGMLLGVMIYCYATGIFSSRQMEAATKNHVAVRYLAANTHPDHDTLCSFRRENGALLKVAFQQVLEMGATLGLGRVGTVCLDGSKFLANAAKRKTSSAQRLEAREAYLSREIEQLMKKGEQADSTPIDDGTKLPRELAQRRNLQAKVRAARELLTEQCKERAQRRAKERQECIKEGFGEPPRALKEEPRGKDQINLTDPQSALMPVPGGGFVQGYNAQIALSAEAEGGLIVGAHVCAAPNDREQLLAGAAAIAPQAGPVQELVVDSGYDHIRHIGKLEQQGELKVYCQPQGSRCGLKENQWRQSARRAKASQAREQMRQRAQSPRGRELLARRQITVEPVFGQIKDVLGFRRFGLRGLDKVNLEWQLVAVAFNCRRLARRWRAKS